MRRYRDSTFRSNLLPRNILSRLTSVFDRNEEEQPDNFSISLNDYIAEVFPPPERTLPPKISEDAFGDAVLAEEPTDSYLIEENHYPHIRALRTDADIGDGLWMCCYCRHENILRHYQGAFPFRYLRCDRCDLQLCSKCHTSEILSPIPYGLIYAPQPAADCEVRYCHVCTDCGLSHRLEMEGTTLDFYGVICAGCGLSCYGDWPRFYIGTSEPYRRDPDSTFVKLIDQRANDAARLAFQWAIANAESNLLLEPSCEDLSQVASESEGPVLGPTPDGEGRDCLVEA